MSIETIGRIQLWQKAMSEALNLLILGKRAEVHISSTQAKDATEHNQQYINHSISVGLSEGNVERDRQFIKDFKAWKFNNMKFGSEYDLRVISQTQRMLAVVIFCQIMNIGHELIGKAQKNTNSFFNIHIKEIIKLAKLNEQEVDKLNLLIDSLKEARDKMIAHADAKQFFIENETYTWIHAKSISKIDFDFFEEMLEYLRNAACQYEHNLRTALPQAGKAE